MKNSVWGKLKCKMPQMILNQTPQKSALQAQQHCHFPKFPKGNPGTEYLEMKTLHWAKALSTKLALWLPMPHKAVNLAQMNSTMTKPWSVNLCASQ